MPYAVVLQKIPSRLTVGESVSWKWSDSRFPSTSWDLVYTLVNAGKQIQIAATADGSNHLIEVTSSVSSEYTAGRYSWQAHVSKGVERYKVGEGSIEIGRDLSTHQYGTEIRSHVKKVLDALEAAIEGRASKTQVQQSVGGVQIQHMTLQEQVMLRDRYAIKYKKEIAAINRRPSHRATTARFAN